MPLFNGVETLKYLCLKKVYERIIALAKNADQESYKHRLIFIENLPASVRTELFCYGFPEPDADHSLYLSSSRDSFFQWLPLTVYLFDAQITRVPTVCICDVKTDIPLMTNFVSFLWVHRPRITSLKLVLLSTNVCYEKRIRNLMRFSMNILSDHFEDGLATRLVRLQITHQCDDSMLKAIGQHAKCLKKLDVSFSFNVTIKGVKGFLFKDIDQLRRLLNGIEEEKYYLLLKFMVQNHSMFNAVCFTLEELDLTYTKINNLGMVTVLSCVSSLKYLSWPRFRPIMKTVTTAWHEILEPSSFKFQLVSLTERNINSCNDIHTIAECMPNLQDFDTSLAWGFELLSNFKNIDPKLVEFWNKLQSLTICLKTSMVQCFHQFLETGLVKNLSELTIKSCPYMDDETVLDLAKLQRFCPNLISLDVMSTLIHIDRTPSGKFQLLKRLTIRSPTDETKSWFLNGGCPALKELKVYHEIYFDYWTNLFIDPPSLVRNQLKSLRIVFDGEDNDFAESLEIMNYSPILTAFIEKCSALKTFGNISTFYMSAEEKDYVRDFIRERNYSLTLY